MKTSLLEVLSEDELLNTHQPPTLDEKIKEKLSSIIDEFERKE